MQNAIASFSSFLSDLTAIQRNKEVWFLTSIAEVKQAERSGKIALILLILEITRTQRLDVGFATCTMRERGGLGDL